MKIERHSSRAWQRLFPDRGPLRSATVSIGPPDRWLHVPLAFQVKTDRFVWSFSIWLRSHRIGRTFHRG